MTISIFDAAKRLCEKSGWTLAHLDIQKLIYLANMFHIGQHGYPLIKEKFEAWDYAPVQSELYHHLKLYGSFKVKSMFRRGNIIDDHITEAIILDKVYVQLSNKSPSWLVAITYRQNGAWAKHYISKSCDKIISNEDILQEYNYILQNAIDRNKKD